LSDGQEHQAPLTSEQEFGGGLAQCFRDVEGEEASMDEVVKGLESAGPGRYAEAFLARLRACVNLGRDDEDAVLNVIRDVRHLEAGTHLIRKGDRPHDVHILLGGWAARYEVVPNGGRSITAFLLPGDLLDQHVTVLGAMDHSIVTLTDATVAYLPNGLLESVAVRHPLLATALWWSTLVDEAVLRAWLVNIGRRDAFESIGHLLCELHARLEKVGFTTNTDFELPLTQDEIADALGLTPTHVNRMLKRLREEGFISLHQNKLVILDIASLQSATDFDSSYLHSNTVDLLQLMA
jgi:CRP-like cAMP-binding protein